MREPGYWGKIWATIAMPVIFFGGILALSMAQNLSSLSYFLLLVLVLVAAWLVPTIILWLTDPNPDSERYYSEKFK